MLTFLAQAARTDQCSFDCFVEWGVRLGRDEADSDVGQLHVLPLKFELKIDIWITMHEDLRNGLRCTVTFDALVKGLAAHVR